MRKEPYQEGKVDNKEPVMTYLKKVLVNTYEEEAV
jgi:hypothetical protein